PEEGKQRRMVPEMDQDDVGVRDHPRQRVVIGADDEGNAQLPRRDKHVDRYRHIEHRHGVPVEDARAPLTAGKGKKRAFRTAADEARNDGQDPQGRPRRQCGHGVSRRRRSTWRRAISRISFRYVAMSVERLVLRTPFMRTVPGRRSWRIPDWT